MLKLTQKLLRQTIPVGQMMSKLNQTISIQFQVLIPQMGGTKRLIQLQNLQKSLHLSQRIQIQAQNLNLSNLLTKIL
ncbi:MAG: hypothetical protein EBY88_00415 [Actinobacteria bacterium]|nr:hypothetical protein [Actinomycetota bacterium]